MSEAPRKARGVIDGREIEFEIPAGSAWVVEDPDPRFSLPPDDALFCERAPIEVEFAVTLPGPDFRALIAYLSGLHHRKALDECAARGHVFESRAAVCPRCSTPYRELPG